MQTVSLREGNLNNYVHDVIEELQIDIYIFVGEGDRNFYATKEWSSLDARRKEVFVTTLEIRWVTFGDLYLPKYMMPTKRIYLFCMSHGLCSQCRIFWKISSLTRFWIYQHWFFFSHTGPFFMAVFRGISPLCPGHSGGSTGVFAGSFQSWLVMHFHV